MKLASMRAGGAHRLWSGRRQLSSQHLWCQGARVCADVTHMIGKTPMVQLSRVLSPESKAKRVLAKLEMQNPGGSVKDRISKAMIEQAEERGEIHPSRTTVVEATSGNTGIGLAMVCAAKGYKCIIIMPQLPPMMERYIICRKFGAHVHLTAGAVGGQMVQNMFSHLTELLTHNPDYWCPRQFENNDNPRVHYETTGPEVWDQTDGDIDYFVAGAVIPSISLRMPQVANECAISCLKPGVSICDNSPRGALMCHLRPPFHVMLRGY